MADRQVTHTEKDDDHDIFGLCGTWSGDGLRKVLKDDAIRHIESGLHSYYVHVPPNPSVTVTVYTDDSGKKHLRTTANSSRADNLDNLPNCH